MTQGIAPPIAPTIERLLKARGLVVQDEVPVDPNSGRTVLRDRFRDSCVLDVYHARGRLSDRQHKAGSWLARVFYRACLAGQCVSLDYSRLVIKTQGFSTPIHDARITFWNAMLKSGLGVETEDRCVLTPRGRVARDVCGMDEPLKGGAQMKMLTCALEILADYLGF